MMPLALAHEECDLGVSQQLAINAFFSQQSEIVNRKFLNAVFF
jgi:hypothetical protein